MQIYTFALMKCIKILLILFILNSCDDQSNKRIDKPAKSINVYRFDQELFSIDSLNIDIKLSEWGDLTHDFIDYYYRDVLEIEGFNYDKTKEQILFGLHNQDLFQQNKIIGSSIEKEFKDFNNLVRSLEDVFRRIHALFPELVVPSAIVTVNGENGYGMTFKSDTIVLCLDRYLGHEFYNDNPQMYPPSIVPRYLTKTWDKRYITRDIVENWIDVHFNMYNKKDKFLDYLIYKGKIIYLMLECMPDYDLSNIFKFSKTEYDDCEFNESIVWNEIIKQNYLYSSDFPSSFFHFSNETEGIPESPSRLGYFIGYKIIDAFMTNNDITIRDLFFNMDSQRIYLQSRYQPNKNQQIFEEVSIFRQYWWLIFIFVFVLSASYLFYLKK